MTMENGQSVGKDEGSIRVILTGDKKSTKLDPLVNMILDGIHDKGDTVRINIDGSDGSDVLLRDLESSIITVKSHLQRNDVLVLNVDLPNLNTTGEVFSSWNKLISLIGGRIDSGSELILILTTVNSYLYPNEFRHHTSRVYKVDHPSKLYTSMLEPALNAENNDVVEYDVTSHCTSIIDLDHYEHDDPGTSDREYAEEFRNAELKVVALGLGMVAFSLVFGLLRLIASINANRD